MMSAVGWIDTECSPCELCSAPNVPGAWVGEGLPLRFVCGECRVYLKAGFGVAVAK